MLEWFLIAYLAGLVIVLAGGAYLDGKIRLTDLLALAAWPVLAPIRLVILLRGRQ